MNTQSHTMSSAAATLILRPERRLIRPNGSDRYVLFTVRAAQPERSRTDRLPLRLGLVVDRSGSMQGQKLETAKRAALAVLDRLEAQDQAALVIFDDKIDVLQPLAPVTPALRSAVGEVLRSVGARGSTALHEGWLTGCQAIASATAPAADAVWRLFLLTDGLANVGETDPERIAVQVGDVLARTGIATSTFGIGDYDEQLLAPMATAGGGQFHHLRTAAEIGHTFLGELGDALAVAVRAVRLELVVEPGTRLDVISDYHVRAGDEPVRLTLLLGDLVGGEERQIAVRCHFPARARQAYQRVRARLCWHEGGTERSSDWQEIVFTYADHVMCDAERAHRDRDVLHWVGQHEALHAQQMATACYARGDAPGAQQVLSRAAAAVSTFAGDDTVLQEAVASLAAVPAQPSQTKEVLYQAKRAQKGHKDHRSQ